MNATDKWTIVLSFKIVCQYLMFGLGVTASFQSLFRSSSPIYARIIVSGLFWLVIYGSGGIDIPAAQISKLFGW